MISDTLTLIIELFGLCIVCVLPFVFFMFKDSFAKEDKDRILNVEFIEHVKEIAKIKVDQHNNIEWKCFTIPYANWQIGEIRRWFAMNCFNLLDTDMYEDVSKETSTSAELIYYKIKQSKTPRNLTKDDDKYRAIAQAAYNQFGVIDYKAVFPEINFDT